MSRFLIITANVGLLVLLVIGLPAATRAQVGNLQISSAATGRLLMFFSLGIAAAINLLAALFLLKVRKQKILCWEWAAVFSGLLLAFFAYTRGWLKFAWLTHALQWLQNHL